jgi:putative redox protein
MAGDVKVTLKRLEGATLFAKGQSNHWVSLDTSEDFDGNAAGTSPFEMLFIAMGGCMSMDMLAILKKKRNIVTGYTVNITAKRRDEYPKIATMIEMEFIFEGEVKAEDVERAIELSHTKYCSVSNMIRPDVVVKHTYRIMGKGEEIV